MITSAEILAARILIVDDQPANVELLTALLDTAGYCNVQSTTDPRTVCALHRNQSFDLILLDLQMPFMDGFQVLAALKTNIQDAYVPVIVLTAQPGHKLAALSAGAKDFISKPFDLLEVKTRIHNMLEVRLLYRKLQGYAQELEKTVAERTAELRESEARYRSLTELASDWYWEQDAAGNYTKVSGPVLEMLGIQVDSFGADTVVDMGTNSGAETGGWVAAEREDLRARVAARAAFLDFIFNRSHPDGSTQQFRVSGEPMFDQACRYIGYRGIGVEVFAMAAKPRN
jgi:CheY-like chemotaxis protein